MPQRSGVAGPLLEKARDGTLDAEQLERVRLKLERLQQQLVEELEEEGEEVVAFREGVLDALADAFTLMHYGLDEMGRYLESNEPSLLRLARLLLEKGEQEYLGLQRELRRVERSALPGERTVNLWGQLLALAGQSEQEEELGQAMAQAELAMEAQLEGTFRDFCRALEVLRSDPDEASRKMAISMIRFRDFLGLQI